MVMVTASDDADRVALGVKVETAGSEGDVVERFVVVLGVAVTGVTSTGVGVGVGAGVAAEGKIVAFAEEAVRASSSSICLRRSLPLAISVSRSRFFSTPIGSNTSSSSTLLLVRSCEGGSVFSVVVVVEIVVVAWLSSGAASSNPACSFSFFLSTASLITSSVFDSFLSSSTALSD